ncbi:glutathione peroxidase [Winogradskyella sp. A3E31]|uniref:glutathione peroxidase n=1 Tax=Winogradskyella sp. A3E31 TaxID=3349637 RepID=UPI00398AD4D5
MNPITTFASTLKTTNDPLQKVANEPIYDIEINKLDGSPLNLSELKGKHILFVNVASHCGYTPQYRALQKLYTTHKEKLMVIGVPCNQFGGQEPDSAETIQQFCEVNYGVTFIITEKIDVKGTGQHPLYKWLTDKSLNGNKSSKVKWNFQKYLVDDNGNLVDYFYSITRPSNSRITKHIK